MLAKIWNWLVSHDTAVISGILALLFTRYAVGIMFKLFVFAFVGYSIYFYLFHGAV